MSMYDLYKTDPELEKNGVKHDFGKFRVTIARAGGANRRYNRLLEAKAKPYRRAIQTETMDKDRELDIVKEVFAETIVLNWEVNKNADDPQKTPEWEQGIEAEDGTILPFNKENVLDVFKKLPDLFMDIQEQASKSALYRDTVREKESGN